MIKNDEFYTGKGTKRLLDEFRAVAGCRTTEQAVRAVFLIASTMEADRIAGIQYVSKDSAAPTWSFTNEVEECVFSPAFGDLIKQKETEEIPMTPSSATQLGYLTAAAHKITDLDTTFSEAFSLAVMMAKDVHDKFGNGQTVNIPVSPERGNPLTERHIHLA